MSHLASNKIFTLAYQSRTQDVLSMLSESFELVHKTDEQRRLLIHWAALGGDQQIVQFILKSGQNADPSDDCGMTPLILASSANRVSVVKELMKYGANVNAQTDEGHSSLQYVASKGWLTVAEILVANGANVNIADKYGATPLHRACSKGMFDLVKFLLSREEIIVDVKDKLGNTPLHLACEEGRMEVIKYLLDHGASKDALNKEKQTPFDVVPKEYNAQLRNLLSSNMS